MTDYTELRKAIEAGPRDGPWTYRFVTHDGKQFFVEDQNDMTVCDLYYVYEGKAFSHGENPEATANYIAAANPAVIKQLLADYDRVKAENERLRDALRPFAERLHSVDEPVPDTYPFYADDDFKTGLTLGDFRRARAEIGEG